MTLKRIAIAVLASVLCGWGIWQTTRAGLARTLDDYAARGRRDNVIDLILTIARVNDPKAATDRAAQLTPGDAEAHSARGDVLQTIPDYRHAQDEYTRAVQLRPRDYFLWLLLGIMRDQNRDQEGALRALKQSVALAPAYAPPRWQLGNLLLRMGRLDESFSELRQAANSNPTLWPNVIDLAWGVYGHDPAVAIKVLQPETDSAHMALANFFASHNQGAAALEQFRATRTEGPSTETLLYLLLQARAFAEAYEVWAQMHGLPVPRDASVHDGGFEEAIVLRQLGFGWQITPNVPNVTMSLDEAEHQNGERSLRLDFSGNSSPSTSLLTQLVLVKPLTHYHLRLFALSKEFVSAAEPVVTISDASDPKSTVLAQSPPLRSDPQVWREFAIDFTTNADTRAITIAVARQSCANDPCPAFGTVWLDSVSIGSAATTPAPK